MCGIAGILSLARAYPRAATEIAAMTRHMAHRGPDDEGFFLWNAESGRSISCAGSDTVDPLSRTLMPIQNLEDQSFNVAFGHRRFSIIDVTPAGHQPFMDRAGRAVITFNGEIYNYVEIREELQKLGVVFDTHGDTEVLLYAYLTWGEDMFGRLNGMWAFAIFDLRTRRVLFSRDRVGEKSLFYSRVGDRLCFASEIKGLFAVSDVWNARRTNAERVYAYLYFGLRDHNADSFFANVSHLPPAHFAWVEPNGEMCVRRFWQFPRKRWGTRQIGFEDAGTEFARLLGESVRIRLRADVPLAAEISSGMDSSSIVALAQQTLASHSPPQRLVTYTATHADLRYDESEYAQLTAKRVGAEFNPIRLDAKCYWPSMLETMYSQEQPFHSPGLVANSALWPLMKARGIKIVLNGGGGDELLGGYISWHVKPFLAEMLRSGRWVPALREAFRWDGTGQLNALALHSHLFHNLPGFMHRWRLRRSVLNSQFPFIVPPPSGMLDRLLREHVLPDRGMLSAVLLRNMEYSPLPMYMVQGDKVSMAIPIEIRLPFLDFHVMDFAFQLPVEYLIRRGLTKAVLRHGMRSWLPPEVLQLREKRGFSVPLDEWMRDGAEGMRAAFGADCRSRCFVDAEAVTSALETLPATVIWRLHQVELWMRVFDMQ